MRVLTTDSSGQQLPANSLVANPAPACKGDTQMKIAVVGGGRMGLPLACMFGKRGASIVVCDINVELVAAINAGACPYSEPGLAELMAELHGAERRPMRPRRRPRLTPSSSSCRRT